MLEKEKLFINPFYKFIISQYVKRNLYFHESCIGKSASTFEVERHLYEKKLFKPLSEKIVKSIYHMTGHTGQMHSMWFNLSQRGGKINKHHHNNQKSLNKISGAYYLQKPKNSGNLIIYDPDPRLITVETNDIVIFHASLLHGTEESCTDKYRIVCGFNFISDSKIDMEFK